MGSATLITSDGYKNLKEKQERLKREIPETVQAISDAREKGDLKENADYHAAREKKALLESQINQLEHIMTSSTVFNPDTVMNKNIIGFGATITLMDETLGKNVTYTIVSEHESDISKGLLSYKTPIARALLNKSANDAIEVSTPKGIKYFKILEITYTK